MEICPICQFEAKNKNGLRFHLKKHNLPKQDEIGNKEVPKLYRVQLYKNGELVISYPVLGESELEKAKLHAQDKGYEIKII
jgi:hypothetical protein